MKPWTYKRFGPNVEDNGSIKLPPVGELFMGPLEITATKGDTISWGNDDREWIVAVTPRLHADYLEALPAKGDGESFFMDGDFFKDHVRLLRRPRGRVATITLDSSTRSVSVDGKKLHISPSLGIRQHSPTGFAWGYGGSGPAQLALAILLRVVGADAALAHYQAFKRDHVACWPMGFSGIRVVAVDEWVKGRKAAS